jgi:hypothetical protein
MFAPPSISARHHRQAWVPLEQSATTITMMTYCLLPKIHRYYWIGCVKRKTWRDWYSKWLCGRASGVARAEWVHKVVALMLQQRNTLSKGVGGWKMALILVLVEEGCKHLVEAHHEWRKWARQRATCASILANYWVEGGIEICNLLNE